MVRLFGMNLKVGVGIPLGIIDQYSVAGGNVWIAIEHPGDQNIQYGCQVAVLKVVALKINRLLSISINNMHMKYGKEIPKQIKSYTA